MTEEHDAVEAVGWNADDEDNRIDVADKDVVYGDESLKADDVVGVVPRNKAVYVIVIFAVTVVDSNLRCHYHGIRNFAEELPRSGLCMFSRV